MPEPMPLLPARVDALRSCQQQLTYRGSVPLARLGRLAALLAETGGSAESEWLFHIDEQGRKLVQGTVRGMLAMQCQRCLSSVHVPVETAVTVALVWNDEQAAQLPRSLEPVQLESNELDLHALVEDELLLGLPLSPLHQEGECQAPEVAKPEQGGSNPVTSKENPFQVLAALKSGNPDRQ